MDKILVFNTNLCTGCRLCESICSLVHTQTCNPERSRIRVLRKESQGINIQRFCQQCENAPCAASCPVSAIQRNEATGALEIDDEVCIQCEECIPVCPFDGIYFDRMDRKVIKCDLCGGNPKCVMFCETKAIEILEKDPLALQKKKDSLQEADRLLKVMEEA